MHTWRWVCSLASKSQSNCPGPAGILGFLTSSCSRQVAQLWSTLVERCDPLLAIKPVVASKQRHLTKLDSLSSQSQWSIPRTAATSSSKSVLGFGWMLVEHLRPEHSQRVLVCKRPEQAMPHVSVPVFSNQTSQRRTC